MVLVTRRISTGRKYVPISKMWLISNDIPRIGSALHFELQLFPLCRIEKGQVSGRLQRLIKSSSDESKTCT